MVTKASADEKTDAKSTMRKHAAPLYCSLLALVVVLAPSRNIAFNSNFEWIVAWVPVAKQFLAFSQFPAKTLAFQLASIAFLPIYFWGLAARLPPDAPNVISARNLWNTLLMASIFFLYSIWLFSWPSLPNEGRVGWVVVSFSNYVFALALLGPLIAALFGILIYAFFVSCWCVTMRD